MTDVKHPYQDRRLDSEHEILVVGYPKSGNTWIARLIAEFLDSPLVGYEGAVPIATEGLDRRGDYVVRQLHLKPGRYGGEHFLRNGWQVDLDAWEYEKVVFVMRDPRDVAVSAMHYWGLHGINRTIQCMGEGIHPLKVVGSWSAFYDMWLDVDIGLYWMSYEYLSEYKHRALKGLLANMGLIDPMDYKADTRALSVFQDQEINTKREKIIKDGHDRPYGINIQKKNLRKGVVGDYKNYFSEESHALAKQYFGDTAARLFYRLDEP